MDKKIVTFGEIMLRLATPERLRFGQTASYEATFGGGEANVAVSLARFGEHTQFITRLPQNDLAEACLGELRRQGVDTSAIIRGGERLGIYFLETGATVRPGKVVYDRAHSSMATIQVGMIDWEAVLSEAGWFHFTGITPALSESAAEVCLEAAKTANQMGVPVSCDLNYRKNLWKYGKDCSEVMPELAKWCDLIIANEEDAEKVFGIRPAGFDATATEGRIDAARFQSVAEQLTQKFPRCKRVAITLRGSINADRNTWGAVLWEGDQLYTSRRYDLTDIVDRVGGGDSFGAGLIYGLDHYPDPQQALEFAVAASALKHTVKGDFNLVGVDEVEKLMQGDGSGRVAR